jgi:pre-mRNA-processing factor 19
MSYNICSLSGLPAEHPVICIKTGRIFEKSLIEKHIITFGKCPLSDTDMTLNDLLEVKIENQEINLSKPRNSKAVSIPGMLSDLESDWEKLLIETALLRKEYDETRKELAHSLYQNDASTRVIANLIRERDSAREELLKFENEYGRFDDVADILGDEYNGMGISQILINSITDLSFKLSSERKNRKVPHDFSDFSKFKLQSSTTPFENGSNLVCSDVRSLGQMVVGSADGKVAFYESYDFKKNPVVQKLHTRKINQVQFYPSEDILAFATVSDDSTGGLSILSPNSSKFEERYRIKNIHNDSLSAVSFHPLQEYAIISSLDANWSFHNMIKVFIYNVRVLFFINTLGIQV